VLGSTSTHTRSGIGGIGGRGLMAGDVLPIRALRPAERSGAIQMPALSPTADPIRLMPGPQADYFAPDQLQLLCGTDWTVSGRSDRMAYMLDGPRLVHAKGYNIVSDGITMGAIQVPGDGRAIVLMADRQPTGGYPKIATVIGADLGRLAQLRPGERFRFAEASREAAVAARRAQAQLIAAGIAVEPLVRTDFSSEYLLTHNLIAGVTAGSEAE
jgi:allophanate hydrolase subunit 2